MLSSYILDSTMDMHKDSNSVFFIRVPKLEITDMSI